MTNASPAPAPAPPPPIALITGGAHRLGAAMAVRLAGMGYTLALHGRHAVAPDADVVAAAALGWRGFTADLALGAEPLFDAVVAHYSRAPDVIINNASRFVADTVPLTSEDVARTMAVNVTAPVVLATMAAAANPHVCIINILDQRVIAPPRDQLGYGLSKQALWQATATLARTLAPARVNAVAPGLTLPTADYDGASWARIGDTMPLGALPDPAAIADAVAYLVTAQATTGQTIFVDGGAHLHHFPRDFAFM